MNRKQPRVKLRDGSIVKVPRYVLDAIHEAVLRSIEFQHFGKGYEVYYNPEVWECWLNNGTVEESELPDHAEDVINHILDGSDYVFSTVDPV